MKIKFDIFVKSFVYLDSLEILKTKKQKQKIILINLLKVTKNYETLKNEYVSAVNSSYFYQL